jgi:hypothetical protein
MPPVISGNEIIIPMYSEESEKAVVEITWSQNFRTRTVLYYVVRAKNQQGNENVLLYIQNHFCKDSTSHDYLGLIPPGHQSGSMSCLLSYPLITLRMYIDSWIVGVDSRFQYGQKNKEGEGRWLVLHSKDNKLYQVSNKWKSQGFYH